MLRAMCVFCGSNLGDRDEFREAAHELGTALAKRRVRLIYGGASVGLMGVLADAALAAGGEVIGVLPRALFRSEVAHTGLSELHSVGSMHERKALMTELADAFAVLPGGFGTFDELFEAMTWAQLGIHRKPIALLDVANYFAPLRALVAQAMSHGFIRREHAHLVWFAQDVDGMLERLGRLS